MSKSNSDKSNSNNLNNKCSLEVLKTRQELSDEIREVVRLVTFEPGIMPVGTFRYEVFKYPGDIDIFEPLEECCNFSTAKLSAAHKIQSIITDIVASNKVMFVEFKAGYDFRYKIYTGVMNHNILDYNPDLIRRDINNLYHANLLTCEEWHQLDSLIKDMPSVEDVIALNEMLREYWVLRWTTEEILQGYKLLRGDYKLYLDVALSQGTIVKLDTISYVEGRFVEVTNFFLITLLDKFGTRSVLSEELKDYAQSLLMDIYKYYETSPLKSIKRLWMYLAFQHRICDLSLFTSLFSSEIARYSQILADLEVGIKILSPNLSHKFIEVYGEKGYDLLLLSLTDKLRLLKGICTANIITKEQLEQVYNCLQERVNELTYQWLEDKGIQIFDLLDT